MDMATIGYSESCKAILASIDHSFALADLFNAEICNLLYGATLTPSLPQAQA